MNDRLCGRITVTEWQSVPVIKSRLATAEDARAGRAVFYIENTDLPGAAPLSVRLPALALVKDEESGEDTVVTGIQAEQTSAQKLVGFRYLKEGSHYV